MIRILIVFLCLQLSLSINLIGQTSSDESWEIMLFKDDVNVDAVIKKFNAEWEGRDYIKSAGIKPFRRWEQLNKSRVNEFGRLDRFTHVQTFRTWIKNYQAPSGTSRSLTCPVSPTGDWTSKGPIGAVENYGIGRINALAFHPTDTNQIWAAAPSGGLWVTYDYGENWTTFTDDFATLGFSDIVFNPSNPNTIYAATGDKDSGDAPSIGVLKTTDGGLTWNVIYSTSSRIHRLLINPNDTSIVLAAMSSGVKRTTNGGTSWVTELSGDIRHMEYKPGDPTIVYASEYASGADFYRSINSGGSFSPVALPSVTNAPARLAIAVTPANSNIVYLSGGYNDASGVNDFSALFKSTNGGVSFVEVVGTKPTLQSQYWYDWTLTVSPTNPDILFAGGASLDKSSNGGASWTNNGSGVHVDHHYAGFHPLTNDIFVGSDGGVYYTSNHGTSWKFVNRGMSITQYYRMTTSDTEGDMIMGGSQDNGTHMLIGDYWDRVNGGDGMECIINHQDPNIVYAEYQRGIIRRSTNKGVSFSTIFSPSDVGETGNWVTPYIMNPANPDILYVGYNSVHKSLNGGTTFSNSSGNLGIGTITILAISDFDPNYVYAGDNAALFRTTNGGSTWLTMTSPSGTTRYITVDPKDRSILYAASSNDVYKSTNHGSTWSNISGTLPNIPMNCVEMQEGPDNPLYVGTDFGVYYKDDNLANWILFSDGLPNVIIEELEIDECQGMIRAASYGRGMWESPLYCTDVGTICCSDLQPQLLNSTSTAECGGTVELAGVPGPNNYDIEWYKDGSAISGATGATYNASESGIYTYKLINTANSSCNSLLSKPKEITIISGCAVDSTCTTLNPNTDNGQGNITQLTIAGSFDDLAVSQIATLCISVNGDFGSVSLNENFTIYDESGNNRGSTNNVTDCSGPSTEVCFTITTAQFNSWNNDNLISVNLDPESSSINPTLCAVNEACMRLFLPSDTLPPCPPNNNLSLPGVIASNTYSAAVNISSDGIVETGSNVIMESGDNIDLNQNFEVENNAEFEAKTTPCYTPPSPFESGNNGNRQSMLRYIRDAVLLND